MLPKLATSPFMATEAEAEAFILPVPAMQAISKLLTSPVASTDAVPASHVESTDVPVSQVMSTEAIPEQPTLIVLTTKAIPAPLIQPVKATEAISEHTTHPVTAMEAVPKQPVVTAAEAFSESLVSLIKSTREILATLTMATKYKIPEEEPPESASVQEPPECAMEEDVSTSTPDRAVAELAEERTV